MKKRSKFFFKFVLIIENSLQNQFIHFQLQCPLQFHLSKGNLGKIMLVSSCCSEMPVLNNQAQIVSIVNSVLKPAQCVMDQ
jgi:hypothetical protein